MVPDEELDYWSLLFRRKCKWGVRVALILLTFGLIIDLLRD
jgi:hypothetical protein